ncbi:MAG: homoserine dehydrogenase [Candidatus Nezhaarchaeota archaeon]|nr:homoserine dehydrogenase [Candidatus Nezhaarchaeota archaeon]
MRAILIGYGFIGRSLVDALHRKMGLVKQFHPDFKLVGVASSRGYLINEGGLDLERLSRTTKISEYLGPGRLVEGPAIELIRYSEADVVFEATPTNIVDGQPGITHMEEALKGGMHVVTSNKGPLVIAYRRLVELAASHGVELKFEATVAGAIPLFSLVKYTLRGSEVKRVYGILNGTTNYILTRMHFDGVSFDTALQEAKERGIAERDPSYDVEGIDAACKLVIIANAIMGREAKIGDVRRKGVSGITREAVMLAKKAGYAIKSVASADEELAVKPRLVPLNHPLCVHGTLNVVCLETDLAGKITLVGPGAGRETVAAMINDLLLLPPKAR